MNQIIGKDAEVSSWPKGIAVVTLFVEDFESTKQFYRKVSGLPLVFEDNDSSVFKLGNMLINLLKTSVAGSSSSLQKWQVMKRDLALSSPSTWIRNFQNFKIHIVQGIFQCLRKQRTDRDRACFIHAWLTPG
jgi:hypothetical protein